MAERSSRSDPQQSIRQVDATLPLGLETRSPQMSNTSPPAAVGLAGLQTEARNPRTGEIDRLSTFDLCRLLNREDARVAAAVESSVPIIAQVVDLLSHRVRNGGRVFYIGAGTSGR